MATLKLPRDILAKFLPDHRAIIAFEKMFVDIDDNQDVNTNLINDVSLVAGNAIATAVLAVALVAMAQELAELGASMPSLQPTNDDDLLGIAVREEVPLSQDFLTLNSTQYALQQNQLGFNGVSVLVGDTPLNTRQYAVFTNAGTTVIAVGTVVAIGGIYIGIAVDAIAPSGQGRIVTSGVINIATTGFTIGNQLYTTDGTLNNTAGTKVGIVIATNQILVRF